MGILEKNNELRKQRILKQQEEERRLKQLTKDELKYLLTLISKSEFIGKDLQIIYSIVAKLQNQLNQ